MVSSRVRGVFRSPTPVVLGTIILLVVVYVVTGALANIAGLKIGADIFNALVLRSEQVRDFELWRLVSYGLLHDPTSPFHLAMNCLMMWFFGRDVEHRFGSAKFVGFLLGAVALGGASVFMSSVLGIGGVACIGFSGAVEACITFWALSNRNAQVLFFFAIPMKGIHMFWLGIAMWILDAVSASQISAAAHFGGIVFGLAVYFATTRRNSWRLIFDDVLVKLRIKKQPRLTVVPKNDRWVN